MIMHDSRKGMIFFVTSTATFMSTFSVSSLNMALPSMAVDFSASIGQVSWVSLVYMLVLSSLLLIAGRLGDIYGNKKIFIGGFFIFSFSSLITPILADSFGILLVLRGIQGLGASMVTAVTFSIIAQTFPPRERGRAIGINAVFVSLGLAVGPTLGGFMLTYWGWPSLFYVNAPIGFLGVIFSYFVLQEYPILPHKLDWWGGIFLGICISLLILLLNGLSKWGILSWQIMLIGFGTLLSGLFFVYTEKRQSYPLVEFNVFRNKIFSFSCLASFFFYTAQMIVTFVIPFYLVDFLNYGQDKAGVLLMFFPLFMMFSAPFGGFWTDRRGLRPPSVLGLLLVIVSSIVLCFLNMSSSVAFIVFSLMLFGIGCGFFTSPINNSMMGSVTEEYLGLASSVAAAIRNIAQALGVALASMTMELGKTYYQSTGKGLSLDDISILSLRNTFILTMVLTIVSLLMIFMSPYQKKKAAKIPASSR